MPKIGPGLAKRLENAREHDIMEIVAFLEVEPARETLDALRTLDAEPTRDTVVERMRSLANESQNSLLEYLSAQETESYALTDDLTVPQVSNIEPIWINNSIKAHVTLDTLNAILEREDVVFVDIEKRTDISELIDYEEEDHVDRAPQGRAEVGGALSWSVAHINAPLLWKLGIDGSDVVVAVIDTGVNYNHPDLRNRMWTSSAYPKHGYDFADYDLDPMDADGHGTSCAGIVAGDGTEGKKTGVAPGAKIMAIRVGGAETQFWQGLQFAVTEGAHVISMSMSWKYAGPNSANNPDYVGWRRVCESILAAGVLHANSIGNQGHKTKRFPVPYNIATPGNCPPPMLHASQNPTGGISSAISCGATNSVDALASYSGRGPAAWERSFYSDYPWNNGQDKGLIKPDICAPGPGTESCNHAYDPAQAGTRPYKSFGGTSAATPHLGGCLALLANACQKAGQPIVPALIQEALETTAVRIVGQTAVKQNDFGSGRVDIKAAYDYGQSKGYW